MLAGNVWTCDVTRLELLYSARTSEEFAALTEELSSLRNVRVTHSVCSTAIGALAELAARADAYHRVSPPDALVAAAAQEAGVGVLHYDHHFDRLAEVLNFESRWLATPGSLD